MPKYIRYLEPLKPSVKELKVSTSFWRRPIQFLLAISGAAFGGLFLYPSSSGVIAALCAMMVSNNDLGGTLYYRLSTIFVTGCALILGGLVGASLGFANPIIFFIVLFLCGLSVGRVHHSSLVLENCARFFALSCIAASTQKFNGMALLVYALAGIFWSLLIVAVQSLFYHDDLPDTSGSWAKGLLRLRMGESACWRFAFCYAAAITLSLLLALHSGTLRAGWVAIAIVVVMRPDSSESLQLIIYRIIGTCAGAAIASLIIMSTASDRWILAGYVSILSLCLPISALLHRWIAIATMTALVLILLHIALLDHGGSQPLLKVRIYDTLLGCTFALAGTLAAFPKPFSRIAKHLRKCLHTPH